MPPTALLSVWPTAEPTATPLLVGVYVSACMCRRGRGRGRTQRWWPSGRTGREPGRSGPAPWAYASAPAGRRAARRRSSRGGSAAAGWARAPRGEPGRWGGRRNVDEACWMCVVGGGLWWWCSGKGVNVRLFRAKRGRPGRREEKG